MEGKWALAGAFEGAGCGAALSDMRVLFSNPPWWAQGDKGELRQGRRAGSRWPFTIQAYYRPDEFRFGGYYPFPFFMGYAASYAQKAFPGAEVQFRDSITRGESYRTYEAFLRAWQPDWIVIESATAAWAHDQTVIEKIHGWLPGAKIVLTGAMPESFTIPGGVWAVARGEYEKGVVRAIGGEAGAIGHDLLTTAEMNAAPWPMLDEMCAMNYWDSNPIGQKAPHLQVWSSRGCPFRCCFCVWPAVMTGNDPTGAGKRSVRLYSKEYMAEYIGQMIARKPYRTIFFDDDTVNLVDKHTIELCEVMRGVKLPWTAMCRADTSSREVWQDMKDSGCVGVKLGFESGSQAVIDRIINKRLDLKEAAETAKWLRGIGLSVHGTFTIGLPGETKEQRQETVNFIRQLYIDGALDTHQLSGTAEIEGTPLSNMKQGEALKAYPGAVKDGDYVSNPDGQIKAEHLSL